MLKFLLISGITISGGCIFQMEILYLSSLVSFQQYHERYHEALGNVTPADMYYGRDQEIKARREQIRRKTMKLRRAQNCALRLL